MLKTGEIPDWNPQGLLPPVFLGFETARTPRSPYPTTFEALCERFCTSRTRFDILDGLYRLRQRMYEVGVNKGFQWLAGSFVEHVELRRDRGPRDVDVVSFVDLDGLDHTRIKEHFIPLLDRNRVKENFYVDHFVVHLNERLDVDSIGTIAYWYGIFSHTRAQEWKGYIQIPLDPEDDILGHEALMAWKEAHDD